MNRLVVSIRLVNGGPALQRYPAVRSRRTSHRSSAGDVVKQRPAIIVSASPAPTAGVSGDGRRLERSRSVRSTVVGRAAGVESVQLVTAERHRRDAAGTEPDRITSRIRHNPFSEVQR